MKSEDASSSDLQVIKHTLLVILAVLMIATGFMILPDYKWEEFREKSGFVLVIAGLILLLAPVFRLWVISFKQLMNFADEVEKGRHQGEKKSAEEWLCCRLPLQSLELECWLRCKIPSGCPSRIDREAGRTHFT